MLEREMKVLTDSGSSGDEGDKIIVHSPWIEGAQSDPAQAFNV
jgi:hypothetical protein